jgi:hypothetical protein
VVESPTEIGDRMFTEGQSDYYKTTPKEHIISPKVQGLLMRKNSLQHNSTKTINLKNNKAMMTPSSAQKVAVSKTPSVSNFKSREPIKDKKKMVNVNSIAAQRFGKPKYSVKPSGTKNVKLK